MQDLDARGAGVFEGVPHLRERLRAEPFLGGEEPAADLPSRVDLAAPASLVLTDHALPDPGNHVVTKFDQVELVGHEDRVGKPFAYGLGVGSGQVDGDVGDRCLLYTSDAADDLLCVD